MKEKDRKKENDDDDRRIFVFYQNDHHQSVVVAPFFDDRVKVGQEDKNDEDKKDFDERFFDGSKSQNRSGRRRAMTFRARRPKKCDYSSSRAAVWRPRMMMMRLAASVLVGTTRRSRRRFCLRWTTTRRGQEERCRREGQQFDEERHDDDDVRRKKERLAAAMTARYLPSIKFMGVIVAVAVTGVSCFSDIWQSSGIYQSWNGMDAMDWNARGDVRASGDGVLFSSGTRGTCGKTSARIRATFLIKCRVSIATTR